MDKQYETITIKATEIRRNDYLLGRQSMGGQPLVTKVEAKVKWVYVTDTNDKVWEFPKDQENVLVMRETEASRNARIEADHREHRNEKIGKWFENFESRRHTLEAQAKINEILSNEGTLVGYFEMSNFIEAQAADRVEARVHHALEYYFRKVVDGEPVATDLVEMVEQIAFDFKDSLLSEYNSGLSRSTSVVENVMADADRSAQARFAKEPFRFFNTF